MCCSRGSPWGELLPSIVVDIVVVDRLSLTPTISQGNILVDGNLKVYIADFGLAEIAEQTASAGISREATHGLTWYSAPELMEDDTQPSYASDVWSFGCLCLLVSARDGTSEQISSSSTKHPPVDYDLSNTLHPAFRFGLVKVLITKSRD